MTAGTGQFLRRLGLLIEAASAFAMVSSGRDQSGFWSRLRMDPNVALPVLFGLGVVCWVVGTVTIRAARKNEEG